MVRVLTIPVFNQQEVRRIDRPISKCCVSQLNKFLFTSDDSHSIEVSDLSSPNSPSSNAAEQVNFSFPTVDLVDSLIHCMQGNYIATVEVKFNQRGDRLIGRHVRVYANWDSVATFQQSKMTKNGVSLGQSECGMVQPMRARIAGRVTPSVGQATDPCSLEMIEIPLMSTPDRIACCQVSGNLLISSLKRLYLYKCVIKTHETSRQVFLDFEDSQIYVDITFIPSEISICETYICASAPSKFLLFRLRTTINESIERELYDPMPVINGECIDYSELQTTVILPKIAHENALYGHSMPFERDAQLIQAHLSPNSPTEHYGSRRLYFLEYLLQLKINSQIIVDGVIHPISEEFRCFTLKPYYINRPLFAAIQRPALAVDTDCFLKTPDTNIGSSFRTELVTVALLVVTTQEGYLYYFSNSENEQTKQSAFNTMRPAAVYNFTSPVVSVALFETMLHTLTIAGLETYTVEPPSWLSESQDPYYLIDLKSFLGVKMMFLCQNCLVLLACCERSPTQDNLDNIRNYSNSKFTLYNLALPNVVQVNQDMLRIADVHKQDSIQTYAELVHKGTAVLKTNLALLKFSTVLYGGSIVVTIAAPCTYMSRKKKFNMELDKNMAVSDVDVDANNAGRIDEDYLTSSDENGDSDQDDSEKYDTLNEVLKMYRRNCLILADYYILRANADEYRQSYDYYCAARTSHTTILRRFVTVPKPTHDPMILRGLLYCLKRILLQMKNGIEADRYFTPSVDFGIYFQEILKQLQLVPGEECFVDLTAESMSIESGTYKTEEIKSNALNLSSSGCYGEDTPFECDPPNVTLPENYSTLSDNTEIVSKENILAQELIAIDNSGFESNANNGGNANRRALKEAATDQIVQTFGDAILEIFNEFKPEEIPNFVFRSPVIREYATNRIITLLNCRSERTQLDELALVLLYVQKNDENLAGVLIEKISPQIMDSVFIKHWSLLFDNSSRYTEASISDLTILLIRKHPFYTVNLFSELLALACLPLGNFIQIFTKYMPSHISEITANTNFVFKNVLQKNLELHFERNPDLGLPVIDPSIRYSIVLVARFCLSRLVVSDMIAESNEYMTTDNVLLKARFRYLNMIKESFTNKDTNWDMIRLEALLCSGVLASAIGDLDKFMSTYSRNINSVRLDSITKSIQDATKLLVKKQSHCVLEFAKERFTEDGQWKFLVAFIETYLHQFVATENENIEPLISLRQELLAYLAKNLSIERLLSILPLSEEERVMAFRYAVQDNDLICGDRESDDEEMADVLEDDDGLVEREEKQRSEEVIETHSQSTETTTQRSRYSRSTSQQAGPTPYTEYIRLCKRTTHANQLRQFIVTTGQQLLSTLNL